MAVFGFADDEAGEERAERQRQTGVVREPGGGERDQQYREHEEFARARQRHLVKHRTQPHAPNIFMTRAEKDSASMPPMTTAPGAGTPSASAMPPKARKLSSTCAPPSPSTMRFMDMSCGSGHSRPMCNIRNTSPNSARE